MKIAILSLLLSIAAFAQRVDVEADTTVDFRAFHSFAIRDGKLNSKDPSLNNDIVRNRIEASIRKYLAAKGLAFVPSGPADLNLRYSLGAAQKAEFDAYPAGWRGTRIVRRRFTEGTLVINLHAAATKSLVWRSIASEDKSDAVKVEGKLDDMVRKSFNKFPPKLK
jgi:hypothetical protein